MLGDSKVRNEIPAKPLESQHAGAGIPHSAASSYRPDIDGLRAVAILSVLAFHAFPRAVPGGFVGVDVFFVISGYLIGGILLGALDSGRFSLGDFYSRRIKRIFPPLIIVLAVTYAFGWNLLLADEFKQLGKDIAAGAAFVSNLVSWGEAGYFDRAAETKPLLHLWSLGIEEQFYIFWPLILCAVHRKTKLVLPALLALAATSFAIDLYMTAADPVGAFYSPASRCWELASGTLLAQWMRSRPDSDDPGASSAHRGRTLSNLLGVVGFTLIVATCLMLDKTVRFPGAWALLPVAGALLIIRAGNTAWFNRIVLASKPALFVGLTSYAIYLWHWPLLTFLRISTTGEPAVWARCAAIVLSMLLAWLSYVLVESPIRAPGYNRRKVSLLCFALAIIAAMGWLAYRGEGFKWRYPQLIQQLTDVNFSIRNKAREHVCFMSPDEDESKFAAECLERDTRPLIFIWGDSHAGSIYPGFRAIQSDYRFGIAQYTASACPPLVNIKISERPMCKRINDYVVEQVRATKPDVVFLDANWNFAHHPLWHAAYDLQLLDGTIAALKEAGAQRIVLLGSAPGWQDNLPRVILQSWRNDPLHRTPLRIESGKRPESIENDRLMKQIADRLGVEFVSVYDTLCNEEGCLTRLSESDHEITASDSEHLTPHAAEYVMRKIFERGRFAEPR